MIFLRASDCGAARTAGPLSRRGLVNLSMIINPKIKIPNKNKGFKILVVHGESRILFVDMCHVLMEFHATVLKRRKNPSGYFVYQVV